MKRILTTILAIIFCAFQMNAQNTTLDFESAAGGTSLGWAYFNNAGGTISYPANPVSGGINTSSNVLQFDMKQAADPWQGAFTDNIDPFTFDAMNKIVTLKIHKPAVSQFELKFESNTGGPAASVLVSNTGTNAWEELTFDFSSVAGNGHTYYRMVIVPDMNTVTYSAGNGRSGDYPVYIDDINVPTGNVAPPSTSDITFSVDMNDYINGGGSFTTVYVSGTFNSWGATSNPLTDANNDNVWEGTVTGINNGAIEYKFQVDAWAAQENFVGGESCTVTNGGFTNRSYTVASNSSIPTVCWESCAACGVSTTGDITFSVDMNNYINGGGSFTTVYVSGTFNSWGATTNPLTDANNDNVWEGTVTGINNGTIEYKFQVDAWAAQENFVGGESCTVTNGGFTNRSYTVAGNGSIAEVCWEACVNCASVPVELTYFKAQAEGNSNVLSWETATELNNSHFEVERSFNGINFETIGTIEGNGTTVDVMNYNFVDQAPFTNSYYRLRQVDFDGQFEYSEIVNVNRRQVGSNDVKVYPNPASDNLTIDFTSNADEEATITITDMTGRVLISQNRNVAQGENQLNIDLAELPQGNYFVQLKSTTTSTIQAIVKQ